MPTPYHSIDEYFKEVQTGLSQFQALISSSQIIYESRASQEGTLFGSLRFIDQSELFIREYIYIEQGKLVHSTYRFHWQDSSNQLIARWDNAPHHRGLSNFPYHKHTPTDIVDSEAKTLLRVLGEISDLIKVN